ncbi:peptidoglycan-binding protein [Planktomarina temperata]|nr:peptidoglycan-binding protein [Planktomarina temperata]
MALLASASVSSAADCVSDPNECTLKKLCEAATTLDGSNTIWATTSETAKHVALAQSLGMECGITPIVDLCETDPSECKVSEICEKATTESAGQKTWDDNAAGHVALAKEYGLSCEVIPTKEVTNKNNKTICSPRFPAGCTNKRLCEYATYLKKDIVDSSIERSWRGAESAMSSVREAKSRGLTCEVAGEVQGLRVDTMQEAFVSNSKLRRKQIQYALKHLGYYAYGIDGLWGKGTKAGLTRFANTNKLNDKREEYVFSTLLSKVPTPSSFAEPKKKIVKKPASVDTGGLTAIIPNPSTTGTQALAICRPQAELAKSQARSQVDSMGGSGRRTYDLDCSFGSCRARDVSPSGGAWGGIAKGLSIAKAGKRAYSAVLEACLAGYGWR